MTIESLPAAMENGQKGPEWIAAVGCIACVIKLMALLGCGRSKLPKRGPASHNV